MIALLLLALASTDTPSEHDRPFSATFVTGVAATAGQTGGAWLDLGLQMAYAPAFVQGDLGIHMFPGGDPDITMAPGQKMPRSTRVRTTLSMGKEWRSEGSWFSLGAGWFVQQFDTLGHEQDPRGVYLDDSTGRLPWTSGTGPYGGAESIGWVWKRAIWNSGPVGFAEWGIGSRSKAIVFKTEICQVPQMSATLRFRFL
jgi:hypothetical protein